MFVTFTYFHPSLIFAVNDVLYTNGALYIAPGLAIKYMTSVEVTDGDKHSSLLDTELITALNRFIAHAKRSPLRSFILSVSS